LFTFVFFCVLGGVEENEDIEEAIAREMFEETKVEVTFEGILSFRHAHKFFFEKSDLFFVSLLSLPNPSKPSWLILYYFCMKIDFETKK